MDWLTLYSPADLVPFSRDTWLALIARYNQAHLPAVVAGIGAGVLLLWLAAGTAAWRLRAAQALLAAGWLWVGWAFLYQALGELLWAAPWLALGFAVEGALLLLSALLPLRAAGERRRRPARVALWLLALALFGLPFAQALAGQPVGTLGWFGTAPTPTALATLALVALLPAPRAWLLLPLPLAWCLIDSAMLGVFADPLWPLPAVLAVLLVVLRLAVR
jgi:hypothetical protein